MAETIHSPANPTPGMGMGMRMPRAPTRGAGRGGHGPERALT